jgi:hypothetical protein
LCPSQKNFVGGVAMQNLKQVMSKEFREHYTKALEFKAFVQDLAQAIEDKEFTLVVEFKYDTPFTLFELEFPDPVWVGYTCEFADILKQFTSIKILQCRDDLPFIKLGVRASLKEAYDILLKELHKFKIELDELIIVHNKKKSL